jgi:quinol-cytochrome oxidoreductase complex cytochrome b subunit
MLGLVFFFQFISGIFLVFYFVPDGGEAFMRVQFLIFEVNFG